MHRAYYDEKQQYTSVKYAGASKGTPGDAKCATEILGDKNKEVGGGQKV